WLNIDPIKWVKPTGEIPGEKYFGTMGNANFAGGYLGITIPLVFYAFRRTAVRWKRGLVLAWPAAQLWCLWLTSARNGMIALGVAGLFLLFVYRKNVPRWAHAVAIAAVLAAVALGFLVIVHPGRPSPQRAAAQEGVLRSQT